MLQEDVGETRIHFYLNTRFINICNNPLNPKLYHLNHDYVTHIIIA